MIDNNALSVVNREHRGSDFFKQHCRIPGEVLHEAEGFPDIEELKRIEYPTTARVLALLTEVMASVPAGDTKLVDLYANLGNADPLVVACALDGQRGDADKLFAPAWTVVSGDKAVQAKAAEFGLAVITNQEFLALLEAERPDGGD
ncbi:hypothetical protein [Paenarthrobacter nicotinovorans]|uniref:hypothetical protein n=1 Tax=Paenarthrobacter nicotinovorans TaxID=29320 RepID=UPI003749FD0C